MIGYLPAGVGCSQGKLSSIWQNTPINSSASSPYPRIASMRRSQIPRALVTERPVALPLREGRTMFTPQQYRAEATKYDGFIAAAQSPAEVAEYRGLKQSYALHADNLDWLAENAGKTVISDPYDPPFRRRRDPDVADAEQENILRCLGAAVILNWNTIPTRLQRGLFEAASSSGQAAALKKAIAQFLHGHKDDAQKQQNGA